MKSKLLETTIILKEKKCELINTMMDIYVDWQLLLIEDENLAKIELNIKKIFGEFTHINTFFHPKKEQKINFETNTDWQIQCLIENTEKNQITYYPISAILDFDKLSATIIFN
jgi:hypothetical protein